jgi:phenylpropionate dioxygenase-like ring-hydroxylating dioxygenase large terminal subunit
MEAGVGSEDLVHVRTHVYKGIKCNWKVFCDNYLDGGYHVPFAHKGLADSIDMESYESLLFENVSIQRVHADTNRKGLLPLP